MIVNNLDLDIAISEGLISRDQALRLRDLARRTTAAGEEPIDFSQDTVDEPFRFLRGFRDVFVAIGVAIFAVGLSAVALSISGLYGAFLGPYTSILRRDADLGANWPLWLAIGVPICLWLLGFVLAEIITRRYRLPLASLVVAVTFAVWSGALFSAVAVSCVSHGLVFDDPKPEAIKALAMWAGLTGGLAGLSLFYWRYRLPVALALLALILVWIATDVIEAVFIKKWTGLDPRATVGLLGLAILAAAMWYDMKDRLRVTRLSECAFWLHLLAAPLLVHTILSGSIFNSARMLPVFGVIIFLTVVALIIDRRALLVSGLGYLAGAIGKLVANSEMLGDQIFAFTTLLLGAIVLTLGLAWIPIRRAVMFALPFESLKSRLPPAAT